MSFSEDLRREDGPRILDRDAPPAVRDPHELDPDGNLGALEAVEAPHGGGRIANEVEDEHLEFERLSEDARLALGDCNIDRDAGVASLFGPVGPDGALNDGVEFADRDALVLAPCILSDPRDDVGDPRRLAVDARECIGERLGRRRIGHRRRLRSNIASWVRMAAATAESLSCSAIERLRSSVLRLTSLSSLSSLKMRNRRSPAASQKAVLCLA